MSVTQINVARDGLEITQSSQDLTEYVVKYIAQTDSPHDHAITVKASLPAIGSTLSVGNDTDAGATCVGYGQIRRTDARGAYSVWEAEVRYSTNTQLGQFGGGQLHGCSIEGLAPWDYPAVIYLSSVEQVIPLVVDRAGNLVVNSFGDPFDDLGVEVHDLQLVIDINQTEAFMDVANVSDYLGCVNSVVFWGRPEYSWKFRNFAGRQQYYGCTRYFANSYTFESREPDWRLRPIDRGLRYNDGGVVRLFEDDEGAKTGAPGLLNGAGGKLTAGSPAIVFGDPGAPAAIEGPDTRNFGDLGIPTSL